MRVSNQQAAENRERVIRASSRQFRQNGFDGIGISDLMKSAGMTHGGFYKQFKSKDNLIEEACTVAIEENLQFWERASTGANGASLEALFAAYLSPTHSDLRDTGCLLAALGADAPRSTGPIRQVFGRAINAYSAVLERLLPDVAARNKRQQSLAVLSQMVGALILSRAVEDDAFRREILEATVEGLQHRT
ncbi:MAG: TetR/AcrR family transcriptional regulator [Rhodobacterales bacterium]|jgi:TetR/AcrR family transcriptional repressor of nem operon|tara:strand:+ start:1317 stop:1889 length:573 start_codon:yes stop_codon:yes gene_type:complete